MTPKIILIEDDPMLMRALERGLTRAGYEVLRAFDDEQAFTLMEHTDQLAALITDFSLGPHGGDVGDVLTRARHRHPNCLLVLMSGALREHLDVTDEAFDVFVQKPFSIRELRALLAQHLAQR